MFLEYILFTFVVLFVLQDMADDLGKAARALPQYLVEFICIINSSKAISLSVPSFSRVLVTDCNKVNGGQQGGQYDLKRAPPQF